MPETIQLYRVLLAAPSDVTQEHLIVEEIVDDWNVQHGQRMRVRLELTSWKTHSYPAAGTRPQALINRQFADSADLVIAVFFAKFGTPTGRAGSGTEEEINRAVRKKKPVMVYFCKKPGTNTSAETQRDQARIESYQRKFGRKAQYGTYAEPEEFRKTLRNHLALVMNGIAEAKGDAEQ
jgi:hypothetical protein